MAQAYPQQQQQQQQQFDMVPGEQYRYALTNFRIAHEKVEEQRLQLQKQEELVALLRERIALLEGTSNQGNSKDGSVDDFSIRNAASLLEREINGWASDITSNPPASLNEIRHAALSDVYDGYPPEPSPYTFDATSMQTVNLLRHAMSHTISEGIINCLIVTDSPDTNIQLTRIHEHIFSRDPTVAAVWRRQTFSAAVETCSVDMSNFFLSEHLDALTQLLTTGGKGAERAYRVLQAGYGFSRMLHGSPSTSGGTVDAFYRAFVPDLGGILYPSQVELVKRCMKSEKTQQCRVGSTIFPGLVKVTRGPPQPKGQVSERVQTVVRRAQVICECALGYSTA